jgi:ATP-dependent DNA helicase RecQ
MNQKYGIGMVVEVLRGSKSDKIMSWGLNKLSTYGISELSDYRLREIIDHLILSGYLARSGGDRPLLIFGENKDAVLRNGEKVVMKMSPERKSAANSTKYEVNVKLHSVDKRLFTALAELRLTIADKLCVPAYTIFSDTTLTDMCMKLPTDTDAFLNVSGVGKTKSEQHGMAFMEVITEFLEQHGKPETSTANTSESVSKEFKSADIETSNESVTASILADRINCILLESGLKKLGAAKINDWLVSRGYMKVVQIQDNNTKSGARNYKIPTESGVALGITTEERVYKDEISSVNIFSFAAQKFVIENVTEILNWSKVSLKQNPR